MLDLFKRLFAGDADDPAASPADDDRELILAVCALFVEMGRIDETFTDEEMARVLSILTERYGLDPRNADAMLEEAERALEESVDLWQFARVINDRFSNEKKEALIERLWQVVYVDGKMEAHEHYLMNKLANLLRLSHHQLIDAKLRVLHGD